MSGDLLDAVGWVAAVIGVLLGVIGLAGRPVEQWVVGPDGWVLVAPMVSLAGAVLLLGGVTVLLVADHDDMIRAPTDDESSRLLAARGVLWPSVSVAGAEVVHHFGGVLGAWGFIFAFVAFFPAVVWGLGAVDRGLLLWSTRDYAERGGA